MDTRNITPVLIVIIAIILIGGIAWAAFRFAPRPSGVPIVTTSPLPTATVTPTPTVTTTVTSSPTPTPRPTTTTPAPTGVYCTLDAKMCPDGSFVGRVPPTCEFAACPAPTGGNSTTEVTFTSNINQTSDILGVKIMPVQVLEDSRCPSGVQCVWAGTVRISVLVNNQSYSQFTLGTPISISQINFELVGVEPAKSQNVAISPSDYRFNFKATRIQ